MFSVPFLRFPWRCRGHHRTHSSTEFWGAFLKIYRIRNWNLRFENNRTRELKRLEWVPMPNKHDGDAFTQIMARSDGVSIYGIWCLLVQVASRCDARGTLVRDCGKPHDSDSLSRITRAPKDLIDKTLSLLCSDDIKWLESEPYEVPASSCENPAPKCDEVAPKCLEGNGRELNGTPPTPLERKNGVGVSETEDFGRRVGALYGRTTPFFRWPLEDQQNVAQIVRRPECESELAMLTAFKPRYKFFPQSLTSLLAGWEKTLDAARNPDTPKAPKTGMDKTVENLLKNL